MLLRLMVCEALRKMRGSKEGQLSEVLLHARAQAAEALMRRLSNETRFILAVVSGELVVSNRKKADIVADLAAAGYDQMPPSRKVGLGGFAGGV